MRILSTTLLISFITIFSSAANAESDGAVQQAGQQAQPRLANCKDCLDAGYRRGFADAEAIALENTAAGSSSVTTPLSYRKPVYVQAPAVQAKNSYVETTALSMQAAPVKAAPMQALPIQATPRKLPSYVQRIAPQVQPTLPNMQPKQRDVQRVQRIQQKAMHAGHGHHTQAQMVDCELTDSLNRGAGPVTTVISTKTYNKPVVRKQVVNKPMARAQQPQRPARKPAPMKRVANYKHDDHYHHTSAERKVCDDASHANKNFSPVKNTGQKFSHGNHSHHSADSKADCALTDSLNRGGSIVRVVRKH